MNCYFHSHLPAVSTCAKCGVGLCRDCNNDAVYSLDDKPVCFNCSLRVAEEELADARKTKVWSLVKCIFSGIFLCIALAVFSEGAPLPNVWIIAGISGLPAAFKATRRTREQRIMDEVHDRYETDMINLLFGWVFRLIFKIVLIVLLAPIFAVFSCVSNLVSFFKSRSAIKKAEETLTYINDRLYGQSEIDEMPGEINADTTSKIAEDTYKEGVIDSTSTQDKVVSAYGRGGDSKSFMYDSGNSTYPTSKEEKKKVNKTMFGIAAGIAALIVIGLGYYLWYLPYSIDRDAPRTYVLANNLFIRSSKVAGVEHNIMDKIPYGSELITYSDDGDWADVKIGGQKGYVSSSYLVNDQDFNLLHNVWGSIDTKDYIESSKCRLALIDYCNRNNLNTGKDCWQLHTLQKDVKPNNVSFPRLDNGYTKFTEFAFILKNNTTGDRRFAIYSFEEETERPIFLYEEDATDRGLIKNVNYNASRNIYSVTYTASVQNESTIEAAKRVNNAPTVEEEKKYLVSEENSQDNNEV